MGARRIVARARQIDLDNVAHMARAVAHHHHPVGKEYRLVDRMGDEDDRTSFRRGPCLAPDAQQFVLQNRARLRVERGERLVHQQIFGPVGEETRESDALAHTARELVRIFVLGPLQADQRDRVGHAPRALVRRHIRTRGPVLKREADIAFDRLPREQRVILEHDAAIDAGAGDFRAIDHDGAGRRRHEPRHHVQQRRFPAARRADDHDELAIRHRKRRLRQREHALARRRERFGDAADIDRHGCFHFKTRPVSARTAQSRTSDTTPTAAMQTTMRLSSIE
jgi:hypothetical protein